MNATLFILFFIEIIQILIMSNNDENGSIHKNINLEVHEKNNVNSDDSRELPVVTDMIPKSPDNVELHDNVQTDNISVLTNNTYPTFVPPKKEYTIQELQQMLAEKVNGCF